jgi:hypothetical protein
MSQHYSQWINAYVRGDVTLQDLKAKLENHRFDECQLSHIDMAVRIIERDYDFQPFGDREG